ncbi:MAG: alpha-hydroxy-acid oxidizing protein [Bryobacteraceae bacterium]|jgi:isopentenyl diphosphate isomerase/L-lactate dehydrogenase-like FMN-dependent dehydrogenase
MSSTSHSAPPAERQTGDDGFNRRNLLKISTLLGGGGLVGQAVVTEAAQAQQPAPAAAGADRARRTTDKDILVKARERLYPTCRVCPVCDGVACSGDAGGIAGAGTGMSFQNNFTALQRVKLLMRNVHDVTRADTSTTVFGRKISLPAVCAPMGPAGTKFGKGMSQQEWFDALVGGCVAAGTLGAVGDMLTYPIEDVKRNLGVVSQYQGKALYNSKPIPNDIILKWQPQIDATGAAWLSVDVDSGPKSVAQLRELVKAFKMPVVVKGIMRLDDAMRCMDAGVAGIAVSNHGGRRLDHTAGTAEVLPAIAARLKGKTTILTDGCVATGADVLKYLALGADAVMVGRHLLRAAYGGGPDGVALFVNKIRAELQSAMVLVGVPSIAKIDSSIVYV